MDVRGGEEEEEETSLQLAIEESLREAAAVDEDEQDMVLCAALEASSREAARREQEVWQDNGDGNEERENSGSKENEDEAEDLRRAMEESLREAAAAGGAMDAEEELYATVEERTAREEGGGYDDEEEALRWALEASRGVGLEASRYDTAISPWASFSTDSGRRGRAVAASDPAATAEWGCQRRVRRRVAPPAAVGSEQSLDTAPETGTILKQLVAAGSAIWRAIAGSGRTTGRGVADEEPPTPASPLDATSSSPDQLHSQAGSSAGDNSVSAGDWRVEGAAALEAMGFPAAVAAEAVLQTPDLSTALELLLPAD